MAVHFHQLKIKQIKKETPDCVSISFVVPKDLADLFAFKEGQNVTLKKEMNGEDIRRSYSLCVAPHENELKVAVKKIAGGLFSQFANDLLKPGDILDVLPPTGKFNAKLSTGKAGNYLAIAAGSGITPVISIIKHTLQHEPGSNFTLLYGNRDRHSIIFFEELEGLKNKYMNRFNFVNILSREKTDAEIFHGRIDEHKLGELGKFIKYEKFDQAYLCGPEALIFTAETFLQKQGLPKSNIHFELFNTPVQKAGIVAETQVTNVGPVSNVTIRLDGRSFDFNLAYNGKTVLDAALQQGADLPFACKGGVCASCRAKLQEGQVTMDLNYALEEDEIQQGFILTCQSHPRSEKIVVDFDVK